MRNNWLFFPNLNSDVGYPHFLPIKFHLSQGLGIHLLSHFSSLVDRSYRSNHLCSSGSTVLHETLTCISKYSGALFIWLSTGSKNSNILKKLPGNSHFVKHKICQSCTQLENVSRENLMALQSGYESNAEGVIPVIFPKFAYMPLRRLWKEIEERQVIPLLSLAAAWIPHLDNRSSKVDLIPHVDTAERINIRIDQSPIENAYRGCSNLTLSEVTWKKDAIEPQTGIKFPASMESNLGGEDNSGLNTEVLVGTGSKNMRIIKVKSLKVYAFGLYVHPDSVCEKLGPKYASVPANELENCSDFYEDLLREDIHMTIRLVVNCNGLKTNTVKDAFEKSLRNRLQKMNPHTDYDCLSTFGAYFTHDIPLPVGTTINFRQTTDGQLITEISGKQVSSVRSKDLCRAFFDMYIGDGPVSVQAKQEIAQNVAGLIKRC